MRVAILGGAGAMGGLFGATLAEAGVDVTLVDVRREAVDAINDSGLALEDTAGSARRVRVRAAADPAEVGTVDLVMVFVKAHHTEQAVRGAAPLMGPRTAVLSLQNGWGNAQRIAGVVGVDRVLAGVTYHSATLLAPGRIQHAGHGPTFIGELDGRTTDRLAAIADLLGRGGMAVTPTPTVVEEIWSKLALNVCTLPAAALLGFRAGQLAEHAGTRALMERLLRETVAVARAKEIKLDAEERWRAIMAVMERARLAKGSMLQDVEHRRRTEIGVINGAIVAEGRQLGIPTPYNETMVWLVASLEETFEAPGAGA